jgi:N-acetylglucosamine malate deacetylase 1
MNFGKSLLLSPHFDDEALGCGGLLMALPAKRVHVRYFNTIHPAIHHDIYMKEAQTVAQMAGFVASISPLTGVNKLDRYPTAEFVDDIEKTINSIRPQTLLIPHPSYNQDHRTIFEAAITASRAHDTNWYVKNVLVYEQPETLQSNRIEPRFVPHVFVPISIEDKLALFRLYKSQQRGHRTEKHLCYLAGVRGMQCNQPYAEAFMVIRITNDYLLSGGHTTLEPSDI